MNVANYLCGQEAIRFARENGRKLRVKRRSAEVSPDAAEKLLITAADVLSQDVWLRPEDGRRVQHDIKLVLTSDGPVGHAWLWVNRITCGVRLADLPYPGRWESMIRASGRFRRFEAAPRGYGYDTVLRVTGEECTCPACGVRLVGTVHSCVFERVET